MGFYGNVKNTSRTQFYFDRVYPNRKSMEDNKTKDNIFAGRYVLVEYESDISEDDFQSFYLIDGELFTEVVTHDATGVINQTSTIKVIDRGLESSKLNVADAHDGQIICIPSGYQITHTSSTDSYIRFTSSRGNYVSATKSEYDNYYIAYGEDVDPGIAIVNNVMYATGAFKTGQYAKLSANNIYNTTDGKQYFKITIRSNGSMTWELLSSDGSNFLFNHGIDKASYGTDRDFDSTVWQKIYDGSEEKYIMIADLNTIRPTFAFTADAPTATPIPIHYDAQNTNLNYNIHMQTPWGIRTKAANGTLLLPRIDANGEVSQTLPSVNASDANSTYPSDEITYWRGDFYDLTTEDKSTRYYSPKTYRWNAVKENSSSFIPAAVYYNKNGFKPNEVHKSSYIHIPDSLDYRPDVNMDLVTDRIALEPTGYSGRVYNSHEQSDTHQPDVDTQEFVCMLPSIGDTISDIWDLVYGGYEQNNSYTRNMMMEWEYADEVVKRQGLRALEGDSQGAFINLSNGVNTLAGAINSAYDIMGQIIVPNATDLDINSIEDTNIYYYPEEGVFKRKALEYAYTEVDYTYEQADVTAESYSPSEYYYSTNGTTFTVCNDADFDAGKTYYIKKFSHDSQYVPITLSSKPDYNLYYKTPSGDYKFISDPTQEVDYYRFISNTPIKITDYYQSYRYYYPSEDGSGYELDCTETATEGRTYYNMVDATQCNVIMRNSSAYDINTGLYHTGYDNDGNAKMETLKYIYCPGYFYRMYEEDGAVKLTPENRSYNEINLEDDYYIVRGSFVEGDDSTQVWVPDGEGGFTSSTPTGSLQISGMYKVQLLPFREDEYYVKTGVVKPPAEGDSDQFVDDDGIISPVPEETLESLISMVEKFKVVTLEYLAEIYDDEFNYAGSGAPIYTEIYTIEKEDVGTFYKANMFYYQTSDSSYVLDTAEEMTIGRDYFSSVMFSRIVGMNFYRPNHYYVYNEDVEQYILDKSINFDPSKNYFTWNGKLYVLEDTLNVMAKYSEWNLGIEQVPACVKLGTRTESYTMKELPDLGRKLSTMYGLILKASQILEYGDYKTRDKGTVQGCINTINDIVNRFDEIQAGRILIGDDYGRVNNSDWNTLQKDSSTMTKVDGASEEFLLKDSGQDRFEEVGSVDAMRGQWLTLHVNGNPHQPLITMHHNFQPVTDTTSTVNKNTDNVASANASDKISLYTPIVDAMGHVVGKNTETVTLPYGFKTIGTNGSSTAVTELPVSSADIIAENTQDKFSLNTGNKWLRIQTAPGSDMMVMAHALSPISSQANTDYGLVTDETIDVLDGDNTFEVPVFRFDEAGHIIKAETHTITIPEVFTKIDVGNSTDTSDSTESAGVIEADTLTDTLGLKASNKWIQLQKNGDNVEFRHYVKAFNETTAATDLDAAEGFTVQEILWDNAGHLTGSVKRTYTLQDGYKTVAIANSGLNTNDSFESNAANLVALNRIDTLTIDTGNKWIRLDGDADGRKVVISHAPAGTASTTKGQAAASSPAFGETFKVLNTAIDEAGHVNSLEEYVITLPTPSLIQSEGDVIVSLDLVPETGELTANRTNVGTLQITDYVAPIEGELILPIEATDTINLAFSKVQSNLISLNLDLTLAEERITVLETSSEDLTDRLAMIEETTLPAIEDITDIAVTTETEFEYTVGTTPAENLTIELLVAKIAELEERIATLEA